MSNATLSEVLPLLGPFFSIPELSSFAATSRSMRYAARQACLERLQQHLKPWLPDPNSFDTLMTLLRDTGIVITGSFVLRYLLEDEEKWIPASLDFFCPASSDRARKALRSFIEDAGGLPHEAVLKRPNNAKDCGVVGEVAYMMWDGGACLDQVVRIFLTSADNPLAAVPWTWSTLFANCITGSSVIVPYPRTTFNRIGLTPFPQAGEAGLPHPRVLVRTARRGFFTHTMESSHSSEQASELPPSYHTTALRHFRDSSTFTMKWASTSSSLRLRDVHGRYIKLAGPIVAAWQYECPEDEEDALGDGFHDMSLALYRA